MRVYVVLCDDRGCGPEIEGVFASLASAQARVEELGGGRYYVYSEAGEELED